MKIIVCEFNQETNSFNPISTTMDDYVQGGVYEGDEIERMLKDKPCAIAGILKAIEEKNAEVILAYSMYAQSGGPVKQNVVDHFMQKIMAIIRKVGPVDGIFFSYHGATQSTEYDDVCGFISEIVRKHVGDSVVLACSCDLHANITEKMVDNLDIICGYHTYPHIDLFETGYRAAKLGLNCISDKKRLFVVRAMIPMILPANSYSTMSEPFSRIIDYGKSLVKEEKILDFSVFQMQPWLDVAQGGSVVITIGYDAKLLTKYTKDFAQRLFDIRKKVNNRLYEIDEVFEIALKNKSSKPVILADSADSTNAGAVGDNAFVLKKLIEKKIDIKAEFVINDAPAAKIAHKIGVGAESVFSIGATKDPEGSTSVNTKGWVKSLHNGIFMQEGPAGCGIVKNVGITAVISFGNIDVVVCQNMMGNGDPQLYRAFGVEPMFYKLVVVKACTSFKAAYQPMAKMICETNTPGAASSDLLKLNFKKIPKSFYPFSDLEDFNVSEIQYAHALNRKGH